MTSVNPRESTEVCGCEGERDLYTWRSDPDWLSCANCDGRVRHLTTAEMLERDLRLRVRDAGLPPEVGDELLELARALGARLRDDHA